MEHNLAGNIIRRSKRHLNMNELFLSPSLHQKRSRLLKHEALNQNRSLSPVELQTKNAYSLSSTSLNSYNLSKKDFFELQQSLKTIFYYTQSKIISDYENLLKQHLTNPYLQQKLNINNHLSLPLYTNEYFIRNGLLNHNDGPILSLSSSSSMNISLPLALLSNQKYLFTALTSNFTSEISKHSPSSMELTMFKYNEKDETESMLIRRKKVQTWERDNILQQKTSITYSSIQQSENLQASEYYRSSIVRTSSISQDDMTMKITEEMCNKKEENDKLLKIKNTDDLFPMVKVLAPYIIIRDSFHLNSKNIDSRKNEKSVHHLTPISEKQSLTDVLHSTLITDKRRLPSLSIVNQTRQINNNEQVQQRKKNYLLAEFESVLTEISKK